MKKLWLYIKRFWNYIKRLFSFNKDVKEINEEIEREAASIVDTDSQTDNKKSGEPIIKPAIEHYKEQDKYANHKYTVKEIVAQPYVTGSVRNFSRTHPGRHIVYGSSPISKKKS